MIESALMVWNNIYIEYDAFKYALTNKIICDNPGANIIKIKHYKDVFCRSKQNYCIQKQSQNLILAVKNDDFFYKGAPVCQDFNNKNFYYSSCVMNCVCNCEYCYLKGMYPSGHLVIYVNLEDYFKALPNNNMYICPTYDTDLFPLESSISYIKKWMNFAKNNKNVKLEFRTKCRNNNIWNYEALENVTFAFSLSPDKIINEFEHKTSNLDARLDNIKNAQENGFITRLCFDPIIYSKFWKSEYLELVNKVINNIDITKVQDISIGSFRISQTYLKNMRKIDSYSKVVNFPYTNIDGYYQYNINLQKQMESYLFDLISSRFNKDKIFLWK